MSSSSYLARRNRIKAFDCVGPVCVVDRDGELLDFNLAFDAMIASPLRLGLGKTFPEWQYLQLQREIVNSTPGESVEIVVPVDGGVRFRCIVSPMFTGIGEVSRWVVYLLVVSPEQALRLWADVSHKLDQTAHWSRYSSVYDALLLEFPAYRKLQELVAAELDGAENCIDLGAGTGNSAFALLNRSSQRRVTAVDLNYSMLDQIYDKVPLELESRLTIEQCDIHRMPMFNDSAFDGAAMVNTLFALADPAVCLREVSRILQPGGTLVLSTPHVDTDVDALFAEMERQLRQIGRLPLLMDAFEVAREQNRAMDSAIHRFTLAEVRSLLAENGFDLVRSTSAYVDAVVVFTAVGR